MDGREGGCSVQHPHWDTSTQLLSTEGVLLSSCIWTHSEESHGKALTGYTGLSRLAKRLLHHCQRQQDLSWLSAGRKEIPSRSFLPSLSQEVGLLATEAGAESDIVQPASPPGGERVKVLEMELRQIMPLPHGGNLGQLILPQ